MGQLFKKIRKGIHSYYPLNQMVWSGTVSVFFTFYLEVVIWMIA